MSYQQFFKKASEAKKDSVSFTQKARPKVKPPTPKANAKSARSLTEEEKELRLRQAVRYRNSRKTPFPWKAFAGLTFSVIGVGLYLAFPEALEKMASRIEVNAVGSASAADAKPAEKSAPTPEKSEKSAAPTTAANPDHGPDSGSSVSEDLSHFSKLKQRKEELDMREKELSELEEELQKQKVELDKRIGQLEEMRNQIAQILKDRVEMDQEKVNKLVDLYSNMKPKQAAEVIGSINEDLAVEVLAKMKKKSAAEIMNLLPPEKSRVLSEKYTGYRRKMEEPKG